MELKTIQETEFQMCVDEPQQHFTKIQHENETVSKLTVVHAGILSAGELI